MNLFYVHPDEVSNPSFVIEGQEARHISKVLRHSEGDRIRVTDGRGRLLNCRIEKVMKDRVWIRKEEETRRDRKQPIVTLCMGLIKKRDRLEFAVEKATELGVDRIFLFKGRHSQKEKIRRDRLESTALAAMKQSLRVYKPEIRIAASLAEAVGSVAEREGETIFILADETKNDETRHQSVKPTPNGYCVIVGPEGGFSEDERRFLDDSGVVPFSLGKHRLRTETAALLMVDRFKNPER